jgi:hypothetical protein
VGLGQLGAQLQGPGAGALGYRELGLVGRVVHLEEGRGLGHTGMAERVLRIDLDCAREHLAREPEARLASLLKKLPATQVVLVGPDVRRRKLR